jgi:hypothetical protein
MRVPRVLVPAWFEAGEALFPSVRVCEDSIIDLSPMDEIGATESLTKVRSGAALAIRLEHT